MDRCLNLKLPTLLSKTYARASQNPQMEVLVQNPTGLKAILRVKPEEVWLCGNLSEVAGTVLPGDSNDVVAEI